ncbi:MAG: thiamine phosphate synthase [Acidobacteriaceae bacterium]|nr:thiamine phosphate synthase [Acidobacteriaceae bacterium]
MLRYAITDRSTLAGTETERCQALLSLVRQWATQDIAYIQMREKDLPEPEQLALARDILQILHAASSPCRLLINSHAGIALAAGADGVHLTSAPDAPTPAQIRALFAQSSRPRPVVSVSCHTRADVARARDQQADLILFGPVFGKTLASELVTPAAGLEALRAACLAAGAVPVLALGGVTPANTPACLAAGAAGIAGIRLFASK